MPTVWRDDFQHGKPVCTQMLSHHNLTEIFKYAWELGVCPRGSFEDLVFRLILFNQSMEGLQFGQQLKFLSADERYKYCDPQFFNLVKILLLAQINSYTLFWDELHRES